MGKYAQDAKELLRLVGGKENIAAVTHCMTRMRLVLQDPAKADVKAASANNQNKLQQIMGAIAEVFAPPAAPRSPRPATEQARVGPSRPASFFSDPRLLCIPSTERTGVRLCRPGLFPPDPRLLCDLLTERTGIIPP